MINPIRLSGLMVCVLVLFDTLALPAAAQDTPETQAEIETLRERVSDLEADRMVLQSEIREVGGAATTEQGLINARVNKDQVDRQVTQLEGIVESYVRNVEEMEQMQRQVESDIDRRIEEANRGVGNTVKTKAMEFAGGKGLTYLLATETGPLLSIGIKIVDHAGRAVIEDINEDQLGEQVLVERRNLNKAMEVIVRLRNEGAGEIVRIRELEDLHRQFSANTDALAETRRQLDRLTGYAHRDANLERETDAAGDAEEERKTHGAGVTPCGPNRREKPFGVRAAQNKKSGSSDKRPEAKSQKAVAADDECRDITGFWTLTTTIRVHDREVSTPPVRTEITLAEGDGASDYEIFPASKAKAPSGPIMRCSIDGQNLACRRRVQPQACPPSKYVWEPLSLNVAADARSLTGEFSQTQTMDMNADPSGCTLIRFDGQGKMAYRFEPVEASRKAP